MTVRISTQVTKVTRFLYYLSVYVNLIKERFLSSYLREANQRLFSKANAKVLRFFELRKSLRKKSDKKHSVLTVVCNITQFLNSFLDFHTNLLRF